MLALARLLALTLAACSEARAPSPTQVMVVVDSDIAGLDAVRVEVQGMGAPKTALADDLAERPLPRTVAVVHEGGPLGPITVVAEAMTGDLMLVSRRAELSFVRGRNLMLHLVLSQSCVGIECSESDETCAAGICQPFEVDSGALRDWRGHAPQLDGGAPDDGGALDPRDGSSEDLDAAQDVDGGGGGGDGSDGGGGGEDPDGGDPKPTECGGCAFDEATREAHATLACESEVCKLTCEAGYFDADGQRGNGCEAPRFAWPPSTIDPEAESLLAAISESLTIDCEATLDFGAASPPASVELCGRMLSPRVLPQRAGGSDVVVLATRSLEVTAEGSLRLLGERPVVFVVYGDATVDGTLDVSAQGAAAAAGSNLDCAPGAGATGGRGNTLLPAGGGGGGGFGSIGAGGSPASSTSGGGGGMVSADAQLARLRGGCPGGAGNASYGSTGPGGSGGGALQLSVAGTLRVGGLIAAAGGGGRGATDHGDGGGGGGSGGALLLEATRIELAADAWFTANGGGGASGRGWWDDHGGANGADGQPASDAVAAGGAGQGPGGAGAAGESAAVEPRAPEITLTRGAGGGGGGGGLGRIVLRASQCQLDGRGSPALSCAALPE